MKHLFSYYILCIYDKKDTYDLYVSRQSIVSPIVDTHTGFQVQLSIHIRIKTKKEDIVYPLIDIDSILQKVFCLPD